MKLLLRKIDYYINQRYIKVGLYLFVTHLSIKIHTQSIDAFEDPSCRRRLKGIDKSIRLEINASGCKSRIPIAVRYSRFGGILNRDLITARLTIAG